MTRRALAAATCWTLARPDMWAVALAGFLVRGGIVVLAVPILILPTPIGVASWVGADAVTAAGPTERFIFVAAIAGVAVATAIILGSVVGAIADRVVLRAWAADAETAEATSGDPRAGDPPARSPGRREGALAGAARVIAVRIVATVPLVVAAAWAIPRIAAAGYRELTLPDDLATPFPLRVLAAAPEAVVAIVVGLLICELIAGLATVHVVVDRASVARSLGRVVVDLARRPIPALTAFTVGVGGLIVLVGIPLALASLAWDAARRALTGGDALAAIVDVVALTATWGAALLAAGAAGSWRRAGLAAAVAEPLPRSAASPARDPSIVAG